MERIWKTIAEMAIAMLVDSGLPKNFWEEARKHAVYIYNIVPSVHELPMIVHGCRLEKGTMELLGVKALDYTVWRQSCRFHR